MDLVLELTPPAPKYPSEIKEILDEGLECEEGAFLIRVAVVEVHEFWVSPRLNFYLPDNQ